MKYAKYRFCFWLRKTFFERAPCVRIKEYNKLLRLHELTKQFNYAKNNYNYWHLTMHREVNVGKPSPHSQMLPYTKTSWCKRPRRLSKEKLVFGVIHDAKRVKSFCLEKIQAILGSTSTIVTSTNVKVFTVQFWHNSC